MNRSAWSHPCQEYGRVIHQYKDVDGRNLYHFTYVGLDNDTGYVIHCDDELDFETE